MPWTTPGTAVAGDVLTAAFWNEQVRDNMASLAAAGTTLPSSPTDGQSFYYIANATDGVVWHLRYRAASASSYKWEFVGGHSLESSVATQESIAVGVVGANNYVDLATAGPSITLPLGGDYITDIQVLMWNSEVHFSRVAPKYGNDAVVGADGPQSEGTWGKNQTGTYRKNALSASTIVKLQYAVGGGTGQFMRRVLRMRPVRVG